MEQNAQDLIGQLIITGFNGLELSDETGVFLSQANIGGVILFAPNYDTPGQVAELSNQIQECRRDLPLWISVDHEGGRVQRFKKHFTKIPDASAIGAANSPKLAYDIAEVMAKELAAVGMNVNYAPVVDIHTNPKNPVIGNRAYGDHEDLVTKMSTAVVRGHLIGGIQPCVKHFPGHGDTNVDSHFALPKVDTSLEVLEGREFRPFQKAFKSHCAMVMTAHVIVTALDSHFPATLSKKVIRETLREKMRYTGLVISDDLEMKAIADHYGPAEVPRLAIEAGCDMLIYRSEKSARLAYDSLSKDLTSGKLDPNLIIDAAKRITELKKKALLPYHPVNVAGVAKTVGTEENAKIAGKVASSPEHRPPVRR